MTIAAGVSRGAGEVTMAATAASTVDVMSGVTVAAGAGGVSDTLQLASTKPPKIAANRKPEVRFIASIISRRRGALLVAVHRE